MAGRATQAIEDWTYGPARWLGAGLLAGAAAIGMAWSYSARRVPIEPVPTVERGTSSNSKPQTAGRSQATAEPVRPGEAPRPIVTDLPVAQSGPAVPAQVATQPAKGAKTHAEPSGKPDKVININSAGVEELEKLPSIGPALAARIADDRARNGPFRKIEDLDRVKGIGPKMIEKLRPFIVAE